MFRTHSSNSCTYQGILLHHPSGEERHFSSEDADVVVANLGSCVPWRPASNEIKNYASPRRDR